MDFIKFITDLNIKTIIIIAVVSLLLTSLILIIFKIIRFIKVQSRYIRVKDDEYDELFTEIEHIVKGFISDIDVEENVGEYFKFELCMLFRSCMFKSLYSLVTIKDLEKTIQIALNVADLNSFYIDEDKKATFVKDIASAFSNHSISFLKDLYFDK